MSDYAVVESLRTVCIENNFFNAGTNEQYEKMFMLAKQFAKCFCKHEHIHGENYVSLAALNGVDRLTDVIWVCTDGSERETVYSSVLAWFKYMTNVNKECAENGND